MMNVKMENKFNNVGGMFMQREKMDNAEKQLYANAKKRGLNDLVLGLNRITWTYADLSVTITKMNPSKEFVTKMKELI